MAKSKRDFIQRLKDECDQYQQSVNGLHAFAESCIWNHDSKTPYPDTRFGIPRRMDVLVTVAGVESVKELTPDGIAQVNAKYGVVSEMKKHFPRLKRGDPFDQAQSYCAPLKGWWTEDEMLESHDVVLLTDIPSRSDAAEAYAEWLGAGNEMKRPFAIVEFGFIRSGQEWFLLRKVVGGLSDIAHDRELSRGKQLPSWLMTDIMARAKFMETEPPLLEMLLLVYSYALPLFLKASEFETGTGRRVPVAKASVEEVRDALELQFSPDRADPRAFRVPKAAWVAKALRAMVALGLATAPFSGSNRYHIPLRKPRKKDMFLYFAEKLYALEIKAVESKAPAQPDLFE